MMWQFQRLNLQHDGPLSKYVFNCNLRRYSTARAEVLAATNAINAVGAGEDPLPGSLRGNAAAAASGKRPGRRMPGRGASAAAPVPPVGAEPASPGPGPVTEVETNVKCLPRHQTHCGP
jgi:hypothetical protein